MPNMEFPLLSKTTNCRNCYKCIRNCPVKAISFFENKATIINDECILCGHCYLYCPQGVKVIRDDLVKVNSFLFLKEKVVISLAPSFLANYPGVSIKSFKKAAKKVGFFDVEETAVGATLVKNKYDEMLNDNSRDVIISSCCHSINLLIEKYYPEALPFLADVLSPMCAHGKDIKERFGNDTKVVFVGPCIAKKDEADHSEYIDAALSYEEFDKLLENNNIELEIDNDVLIEKSKARLFPTCGGVLKTMAKANPNYQYLAIDGVRNAKKALQDIIDGKIHHCFVEMSTCAGSCINGPLVNPIHRAVLEGSLNVNKNAGQLDFDVNNDCDISTTYHSYNIVASQPSESEINEMLVKMGKAKESDQLNCGSCGYPSCRDKAIAIIQGKAVVEMCLPYLMNKANSLSDKLVNASIEGLMVIDEELNIKLINSAMCHMVRISHPEDVINKKIYLIFDGNDFVSCLQEKKSIKSKVSFLAEYNKYLEMSLLYDEEYHLLICVCRDITEDVVAHSEKEERINKTISLTEEILNRNLAAVQEIASLLGENAASTKVALNRIKETIKDDK